MTGVVILDLDGVRRITSFGVREWILAMRTLPADYLGFVRVRPAILAQFNMVQGFAGRGELITVYTPHLCDACGKEIEQLLDLRVHYTQVKLFEAPPATCPACGGSAPLDDVPESYFAYIASHPPPTPPQEARSLIDGESAPPSQSPFKVEKEVEGGVTGLWVSGALDGKASFKRLADGLEGDVVVVMDGVTQVTPEGLERFAKFADETSFRLLLARVPAEIAVTLSQNPAACGRAKLVSVKLGFRCTECGTEIHEILDGLNLSVLESLQAIGKTCPNCWRALQAEVPAPLVSGLGRLPFDAAPPTVTAYLAKRPTGPGSAPASDQVEESWGKYRLGKLVGTGGMAQLYLARQIGPEGFEKKVALKRLLPHLSQNKLFVDMFLQEARVAAKLNHPNIVQIFDLGKVGNQYYIAMEYIRGWDLNAVLKALHALQELMPIHLGCRIISDVCAGLAAAHRPIDEEGKSLAIVHRDVSPQNILLSVDGAVKLTDFGIAKAAGSLVNTEPGMVRGKVAYMSPEQVRGAQDIDNRTDIFGAAVVLFHCVTGQSLFYRENQAATLNALLNEPIPAPSSKRPGIPLSLDNAMRKALARNRDRRYPSAQDFHDDLERVITELGQPAGPPQLAFWLADIARRAARAGLVQTAPQFTPTGASPTDPSLAGQLKPPTRASVPEKP